jgi:hypothetical protein
VAGRERTENGKEERVVLFWGLWTSNNEQIKDIQFLVTDFRWNFKYLNYPKVCV